MKLQTPVSCQSALWNNTEPWSKHWLPPFCVSELNVGLSSPDTISGSHCQPLEASHCEEAKTSCSRTSVCFLITGSSWFSLEAVLLAFHQEGQRLFFIFCPCSERLGFSNRSDMVFRSVTWDGACADVSGCGCEPLADCEVLMCRECLSLEGWVNVT